MQSTGIETSTSMASDCYERVSYHEDAPIVSFWDIPTQQTKIPTKEHSMCALYADEESKSLNVQERKK